MALYTYKETSIFNPSDQFTTRIRDCERGTNRKEIRRRNERERKKRKIGGNGSRYQYAIALHTIYESTKFLSRFKKKKKNVSVYTYQDVFIYDTWAHDHCH